MKLFRIIFIVFALSACFFACSKSDDNNNPSLSIQGNWTFVNGHFNFYSGGMVLYDSAITAFSGDYVNFTADGKVYSQIQGQKDTSAYSLLGSNQIIINNVGEMDTATISTLTQTNLTLVDKSPTFDTSYLGFPISGYLQTTLNLSK